ncbi:MAG: ABC transporter permease [Candidatus Krumholzibacteriota bacterium]|nr:ABC transporter permease [Candidatus Krumholzibacteriota bacterium]
MRKLLVIARREYLERVKKKSFLVGTILGPVLMAGLILAPSLIFEKTTELTVRFDVIDLSGILYDDFHEELSDTLKAGGRKFVMRRREADEVTLDGVRETLAMEVDEDVIDGYLLIPADILESSRCTFYGKRLGNVKGIGRIEHGLSQVVIAHRLADEGMQYGTVSRLVRNVDMESMMLKEGEEKEGGFDMLFISTFIFIMMLYMTILLWGVAVQRSIIEEKNNRVIEVMLSSVRPFDLLGGKILGVGSTGLTQYAIWAICALALTAYPIAASHITQYAAFTPEILAYFILFYVLGFLFYATLFAMTGSICNTDQEAQQLQQPIVLCLVFTIIIPMAVIQNPDGLFATIVSLIPPFTPIVMFMRISILTPPAWQIALSVALLLLAIWGAGQLAAKIFRTGILMYGKRPAFREIFKWLRRA